MIAEGLVRPALNLSEHLPHLLQLATRYANREPDLADLCIIRLSELHPKHTVITVDASDFSYIQKK
jgi:hypothetical protein